ncbi:hypothetical protein Cri9333_2416 [Crinalium epipsammum PCC 9333]|uniref:Uncharacterized protein n=1 Tax=Crinalium epipsammum PCC 9333 TaxID=1173022 RepID=K9VYR9_9CYAN|nr:hypothetical protein Cri9333_2416 [Crinalium epipsammum PCC 9333]
MTLTFQLRQYHFLIQSTDYEAKLGFLIIREYKCKFFSCPTPLPLSPPPSPLSPLPYGEALGFRFGVEAVEPDTGLAHLPS